MQEEHERLTAALNDECEAVLMEKDAFFSRLGGFIDAALSPDSVARLYNSIDLARFLHVPEALIIHNTSELDTFMLS